MRFEKGGAKKLGKMQIQTWVDRVKKTTAHALPLCHQSSCLIMDPFHKTVMMRFNGHQHHKSSKVFMVLFLKNCMFIYNTILCIISPFHQITK